MPSHSRQEPERLENTLVAEMAMVLRTQRINIDDERAVLVALTGARFRSGDVVALSDQAINEARRAQHAATDPAWAKDGTWGGR